MKYKNPYSVLVVIYAQHSGRVLMLQRQDEPSFWQSVTGTIESGEQPFQTALREVREETGIDIAAQNLTLVDCQFKIEFEIFPQFRYKYAPQITHCQEHWFLLAVNDEMSPVLSEHLCFQWLSPEQAAKLTKSPNNRLAIERYLINKESKMSDFLA
ncbi:dihydroneopterin triphosphate diphosphatase [Muribacter muris]|uniref:Dihydroneopterin triphosphate diphosphatase n=1 Tax=Muribacter muris TaxID=67855 RepID=A0A4Y9K899_9PAST|nr:dihydroneopterin triphosphate diphosphatase [Muribacter muris]MBF0783945.1 dihydroneopterin triphosphate diphosphatase [Muribacter muris]MBF0827506.1 dihydroneopterin triphosphate diphosphatase [Muribacter muris]TFV13340.1 dihydroneopterin triphosphate diphosphatase [Muribacter muris]